MPIRNAVAALLDPASVHGQHLPLADGRAPPRLRRPELVEALGKAPVLVDIWWASTSRRGSWDGVARTYGCSYTIERVDGYPSTALLHEYDNIEDGELLGKYAVFIR